MSGLYLIKRGPRPEHFRAPFHPVILCAKRAVAKWEAGWSGDASWVWSHERGTRAGGWLLERWNGFDIDYGHVVRGLTLPDGTEAAFVHEHTEREPWPLLRGAVWWHDKPMPAWLLDAGVTYPPDGFSQQRILDLIADDGASGFGRERPANWPVPAALKTWEVEDEARIPNGVRVEFTEGIGGDAKPADGVVAALTAKLELPNGRYMDEYTIRRADGSTTVRYRSFLEQQNPHAPRAGAVA
jgi:hypothetical protein